MKAGDEIKTDTQDWRKKYFDTLGSLESEQQKFRAIESVLKRLIGRLCIALRGQSSQLDNEIAKLQTAVRRETTSDEFEKIAAALTDAISSLDRPTNPTNAAAHATNTPSDASHGAVIDDERVRAVLAALLAELRRDPELVMQVDALDSKLANAVPRDQLPEVLSSLTELVGRRINRIESAKQEVEVLLGHMVGKLDEIGQFVAAQNQNQTQSLDSRESLNTQLVVEMKAMGESVESAVELQQIRSQVRTRLDTIGQHLQEFRQRETARANEMRVRNEQMQARVVELEAEANRLHGQLKDEQRQSTIDALTKIPNRLAYEKRMDDELKRFRRFKQPTCIAVWDIDHFKKINDTYGHAAGDKALSAVAKCLAGRIRSTDFLSRYGGEEFVMVLCGTKLEDAVRLIDEMRMAVAKLGLHSRGTPISVTVSSGVTALLPIDTAATAFDRADKAMYQAKQGGRNRCVSQ